ncbi:hypothetical protein [Sporosarcina aquimarina]|uniref:Uncharacterized protein n=1 Tax=Sporosarcina aquimarina TaxID=114975 RepID=A0ABU4FZA9_9BACL|nr:hypothetical protein [Sporosarcina aquimarina]MDW0110052.1 hypothetical protein [Sporosarcina aquimarina]
MKRYEEVEYWDLTDNPKNEIYKGLIKVLCNNSDRFYFITRKELKYNKEIIAQFVPYVTETYKTKKWAGTETKGPAATVFVMESNEETYKLLVKYANSLYDWVAPELPEDLTFIKNNFIWFSCTTHEEFAGFSIRSDYYKNLMFGIEGLKLEHIE